MATIALGCGALSNQANAVQITGSLAFVGSGDASGASNSAGNTTVFFDDNFTVFAAPGNEGSFLGTVGTNVNFTDFSFFGTGDVGFGGNTSLNAAPVSLFTVNGFTFTLGSLSNADVNSTSLLVAGSGVFTKAGFETTPAVFTLSGSGVGGFNFVIETGNVTANVPDGGSLVALLGVAMIGVEGLRRKLRVA
jgi:hypothetical protein